jgi:hypothetical protein
MVVVRILGMDDDANKPMPLWGRLLVCAVSATGPLFPIYAVVGLVPGMTRGLALGIALAVSLVLAAAFIKPWRPDI